MKHIFFILLLAPTLLLGQAGNVTGYDYQATSLNDTIIKLDKIAITEYAYQDTTINIVVQTWIGDSTSIATALKKEYTEAGNFRVNKFRAAFNERARSGENALRSLHDDYASETLLNLLDTEQINRFEGRYRVQVLDGAGSIDSSFIATIAQINPPNNVNWRLTHNTSGEFWNVQAFQRGEMRINFDGSNRFLSLGPIKNGRQTYRQTSFLNIPATDKIRLTKLD